MYVLSLTQLLDQGNGLVGGKGDLGKGGGGVNWGKVAAGKFTYSCTSF